MGGRPCCREVKIPNRLAGCIFCCLFRYTIWLWLCKKIDHELMGKFGPDIVGSFDFQTQVLPRNMRPFRGFKVFIFRWARISRIEPGRWMIHSFSFKELLFIQNFQPGQLGLIQFFELDGLKRDGPTVGRTNKTILAVGLKFIIFFIPSIFLIL